jgi:GrpB-like predicted nucleotidyltransferase (UPF0157 family)
MPEASIIVVPYDPTWPAQFELERAQLARVLQPWIVGSVDQPIEQPIEHIGSTAIAGLLAKPVIDMMVAVASLEASRPAIAALSAAGYLYAPYRGDVMHWFCKPDVSHRTHHVHLVPHRSALWNDRLAFRDYLRAHPETAAEYAALKQQLAAKHRDDREAYTNEKGPFIASVLQAART